MGKKKSEQGDLLKLITLLLFLLMLFLIIPIVSVDERPVRFLFILTEGITCIFFILCLYISNERNKKLKSKQKRKKPRKNPNVVNEESVESLTMPSDSINQTIHETVNSVENKNQGPGLIQSIAILIGTIFGAFITIINIANKMQGGFGVGANSNPTTTNSGYYVCMKCKAIQNVQGGYRGPRQCGCGGNMIWKH